MVEASLTDERREFASFKVVIAGHYFSCGKEHILRRMQIHEYGNRYKFCSGKVRVTCSGSMG